MAHNLVVEGEFHLLGVHQHKLQLRRVPAVEHAHKHGIQAHRFSLASGTGHEQVRHFGHVEHVGLVADRLAEGNGQGGIRILKLVAGNQRPHAHHVGVGVGHFDADGALPRNRSDDADAKCGKAQGDVVLEVLDFADADAWRGNDFIQRDRRPNFCSDFADFDFEVGQGLQDVLFVLRQFLVCHAVLAVPVVDKHVEVGELEPPEVKRGVVLFAKLLRQVFQFFVAQGLFLLHFLHLKLHLVSGSSLTGGSFRGFWLWLRRGHLFLHQFGRLHLKGHVL